MLYNGTIVGKIYRKTIGYIKENYNFAEKRLNKLDIVKKETATYIYDNIMIKYGEDVAWFYDLKTKKYLSYDRFAENNLLIEKKTIAKMMTLYSCYLNLISGLGLECCLKSINSDNIYIYTNNTEMAEVCMEEFKKGEVICYNRNMLNREFEYEDFIKDKKWVNYHENLEGYYDSIEDTVSIFKEFNYWNKIALLGVFVIEKNKFIKLMQLYFTEYKKYYTNQVSMGEKGLIDGLLVRFKNQFIDHQDILKIKKERIKKYLETKDINVMEDDKDWIINFNTLLNYYPQFLKDYEVLMSIDTTGAFEHEFEQIYDNTWSAQRNQASIDAVNKKYGLDIKIEK